MRILSLAAALAVMVIAYLPANAQVVWSEPVFPVPGGSTGEWDDGFHVVGDVVHDGATYHLFLIGGHDVGVFNGWAVGHWTSTDMTVWEEDPANPVLEPGVPGSWDDHSIISIAVIHRGGMFHMWYGAIRDGGSGLVGYATSPDGTTWTRYGGNPLPGLEPGAPGTWNDNGSSPSTVLVDGGVYHMWFTTDTVAGDMWRIGYAWSTDGIAWSMHPDPVVEPTQAWEGDAVYLPEVVQLGPFFAMWYTGMDWLTPPYPLITIGYAISRDGITWGKLPPNPVLVPTWPPCNGAHSTAVIVGDDTVHGWAAHCYDVGYQTSPLEVIFFDAFETGDTSFWSRTVTGAMP